MCGNRVEELESRVKELEASIEGLTDELVECKVRLRELESAVDEDLGFEADEPPEDTPESADGADRSKPSGDKDTDNSEETEADDDIIVA